jgi:hypothetical protein
MEHTSSVVALAGARSGALPTGFALEQNYPNPFNPTTEFHFSLESPMRVRLQVFNVAGQTVETLVDGHLEAGRHALTWDGSNVASGVYFYRLEAADETVTRKMTLLK